MDYFAIDGLVIDAYGNGVPDVIVSIAEGTGRAPDIAAITNEAGQFTFYDVERGSYQLQAVGADTTVYQAVTVDRDTAVIRIRWPD